jgi:hypothetical protein
MGTDCFFSSARVALNTGVGLSLAWGAEDPCPRGLSDRIARGCARRPDAAKKLLTRDTDPTEVRRELKAHRSIINSAHFEAVAREWCENQRDGWTSRYHDQVIARLDALLHRG